MCSITTAQDTEVDGWDDVEMTLTLAVTLLPLLADMLAVNHMTFIDSGDDEFQRAMWMGTVGVISWFWVQWSKMPRGRCRRMCYRIDNLS